MTKKSESSLAPINQTLAALIFNLGTLCSGSLLMLIAWPVLFGPHGLEPGPLFVFNIGLAVAGTSLVFLSAICWHEVVPRLCRRKT